VGHGFESLLGHTADTIRFLKKFKELFISKMQRIIIYQSPVKTFFLINESAKGVFFMPRKVIERAGYKDKNTYTLDEALESFIHGKSAEGVRERTIADYRTHWKYFKHFLDYRHYKIHYVTELTADIIRDYINYQRFEKVQYESDYDRKNHSVGLSPVTINIRIRTLKAMCHYWNQEKMIAEDIGKNIHQLKFDDDKKRTFSDEEIVKLLNCYNLRLYDDWRDYVLIRFLCDCGARINETCHIQPEDVLFDRKSVYLSPENVKSRHGREVPLDDSILRDLKELIEENKRYFGNPQYVFLTVSGKRYQPNAFRHRLRFFKEKAGLERCTPHMFRHYFITQYAKNGDLFSLQKIVDHKNINTTRKYVNNTYEEIAKQHARFSPLKNIEKLESKRRLEK
jgi:integrase/recombinase XerD